MSAKRTCGGCTLCCTLLPMEDAANKRIGPLVAEMIAHGVPPETFAGMRPDFDKPAGQACQHACRGCSIYAERPFGCRLWSCGWLEGIDGLQHGNRPDRAHWLVYPGLGYFDLKLGGTPRARYRAVKVWVDPAFRRLVLADRELHQFMMLSARSFGSATHLRFGADPIASGSILVFPPLLTRDAWWHYCVANEPPDIVDWHLAQIDPDSLALFKESDLLEFGGRAVAARMT